MKIVSRAIPWFIGSLCLLLAWSLLAPFVSVQTPISLAHSSQTTRASTCLQLVPGQNPLTFSDAQLLALGLPSQESIHQDPAQWSTILMHLGQRNCARGQALNQPKSASSFLPTTSATLDSLGDGCNATPGIQCQGDIWAGNETVSSDGNGDRGIYRAANFEINVPTINHLRSNAKDWASYWVGVGGDSNVTGGLFPPPPGDTVVVQDGISTGVTCFKTVNCQQITTSWVEVAPWRVLYYLPLCRLWPGDLVRGYVESNVGNDGYDYFFMENITATNAHEKGCWNSCTVHTNNRSIHDTCGFSGGPNYNSDSATGECIVERAGGQDGLPVARFNPSINTVLMQDCTVNGRGIGKQSHKYLIIEDAASHLLVGCGPINSQNTFPIYWYRST